MSIDPKPDNGFQSDLAARLAGEGQGLRLDLGEGAAVEFLGLTDADALLTAIGVVEASDLSSTWCSLGVT